MRLDELKGHWALITGASSGIGREFARQLACSGMNTILVARRKHLLEDLCAELEAHFKTKAWALPMDLTECDDMGNELKKRVSERSIKPRLICNNAGVGRWERFEASPVEDYLRMMRLNIMTPMTVCHHFFEDLRSFSSSVIINVSSQAAVTPMPFMASYGSSKAALHSLSLAIGEEWAVDGVLVQTVVPGPTKTEFDNGRPGVAPKFVKRWDPVEKVVGASLAACCTLAIICFCAVLIFSIAECCCCHACWTALARP